MVRTRKQSLIDEKASLERRLKEIDAELSTFDKQQGSSSRGQGRRKQTAHTRQHDSGKRPLREVIIGMLSNVDYMLTNTMIRQLYEARYQKGLAGSRLGTLSHDELSRKNKWNTTIYGLTHPIQLVDREIVRVKNVWARSDWPIERRVYTPVTNMLVSLYFLDWHITTQDSRGYEYLKSPAMLRYVEGVVSSLDLGSLITPPFNYTHAKKMIIQEIERMKDIEQKKYSSLMFKTLSIHRQSRKDFDPDLDGDTDLYA